MASLFIGGIAPSVYGQQNQPQLMEILEVQVKPEFTAQYEAAVKESMAWRKENGFRFRSQHSNSARVFIGSSRASAPGVVVTSLISGSHHS